MQKNLYNYMVHKACTCLCNALCGGNYPHSVSIWLNFFFFLKTIYMIIELEVSIWYVALVLILVNATFAAWSNGFWSGPSVGGVFCMQQEWGASGKLSFRPYAWVWRVKRSSWYPLLCLLSWVLSLTCWLNLGLSSSLYWCRVCGVDSVWTCPFVILQTS